MAKTAVIHCSDFGVEWSENFRLTTLSNTPMPNTKAKSQKSRAKKGAKKFMINSIEQWEALSSPTRAAIIECLTAIGPSSIKEIAASLGRSPELVHHHMPMLVETGFVVEEEPRQLPRHTERVFADNGLEWVFDAKTDPAAFSEGMSKMARAWSRANERLVADAVSGKDGKQLTQVMKSLTFRSESAFLRPAAEEKVRKHLEAIKTIFQAERTSNEGEHRTIYWSMVPLESE